jgi:hypothetical protein
VAKKALAQTEIMPPASAEEAATRSNKGRSTTAVNTARKSCQIKILRPDCD